MSDNVCSGFEPQNYLRERCKKCFRLKSKHNVVTASPQLPPPTMPQPTATSSSVASPTSPVSTRSNKEKRYSWRDPYSSDGITSPEYESKFDFWRHFLSLSKINSNRLAAESMTETSSVVSFKSANSRLLSNAKSMESILSNTDDRCSMVTAASGSLEVRILMFL